MSLAAAEGAPFIGCAQYLGELELYDYDGSDTAPEGAGYYRQPDAPPPDPYEQARAVLNQASEAGAYFVACAEPLPGGEPPYYEYRSDGPDGAGYYRHAAAPPPADAIEQVADHPNRSEERMGVVIPHPRLPSASLSPIPARRPNVALGVVQTAGHAFLCLSLSLFLQTGVANCQLCAPLPA